MTSVRVDRWATVRYVVVIACLCGAQVVHWSVIDQHAEEWQAAGTFFFVLALAEGALTIAVVLELRPRVAVAVIVTSVVPVVVWAWDRSVGLPFGPDAGVRGTIGRSDVLSVLLEVLTIVAVWPFLRSGYGEHRPEQLDVSAKVVIGATVVYVAGFSFWALIGDSAAIHRTSSATEPGASPTTLGAPSSSLLGEALVATQTITYVGTEYAFRGPSAVAAAVTTIELRNAGDEFHELELARIPDDTPTPDTVEALEELFADAQLAKSTAPRIIAGIHSVEPGATSAVTVDLTPGRYIVSCAIAAPNGQYHYAQGMIGVLTVAAP